MLRANEKANEKAKNGQPGLETGVGKLPQLQGTEGGHSLSASPEQDRFVTTKSKGSSASRAGLPHFRVWRGRTCSRNRSRASGGNTKWQSQP